jgi:predicted alpha/beta superfamily hydrolase
MAVSREALYGHSYGGLFALHALFTRTHSFDCYIASSPSIWWNDNDILHEAESFLKNEQTARQNLPSLMVFWGSLEQNPCQWDNEALDKFEERKRIASIFKTTENSLNICKMLRSSKRLHTVLMSEFEGEEHTSVMACSTNRSLTMFFEDWPLRQS